MGVNSIRFNEKDEKLVNYLKNYFHCDTSTLIKKAIREMYEDLKDREIINEFEKNEKAGKINFKTIDKIL